MFDGIRLCVGFDWVHIEFFQNISVLRQMFNINDDPHLATLFAHVCVVCVCTLCTMRERESVCVCVRMCDSSLSNYQS